MDSNRLIESLATELRPVRRMPPPGLQAMLWLALAIVAIMLAMTYHGLRPDLLDRMLVPQEAVQLSASIATGIAAALAGDPA